MNFDLSVIHQAANCLKTHPGIAKVEVNGLGVTDVKNTIRFRWKPCLDLRQTLKHFREQKVTIVINYHVLDAHNFEYNYCNSLLVF